MKRWATDCDRCGQPDRIGTEEFAIAIRRKADAAGGMETEYVSFDLCPKCQASVLNEVLKIFDYESDPIGLAKGWVGERVRIG